METRLKRVLANVLGVDESNINDSTSPEAIEAWDSLKHMNIVVALEEEFGVQFTDEQIVEMLNYKLILYTLTESLKAKT